MFNKLKDIAKGRSGSPPASDPTPASLEARPKPANAVPEEITAEYFAETVATMNRFVARLSASTAFEQASLNLTEWLALTALQGPATTNNKQMTRHLGLPPQRANQIIDSLRRAGLISVLPAEGESRATNLQMTELGQSRLKELNAKLFATVESGLKGEERTLARANKGLKALTRAITPPKSA